ncbi:unnamed protein product [Arctogadus glacialis]
MAEADVRSFLRRLEEDFPSALGPDDPLPLRPLTRGPVGLEELQGESLELGLRLLDTWSTPPALAALLCQAAVAKVLQSDLSPFHCPPQTLGNQDQEVDQDPVQLLQSEPFQRFFLNTLREVGVSWHRTPPTPPTSPASFVPLCFAHAIRNTRRKMEDRHVALEHFSTLFNLQDGVQRRYYGVFDGHGGVDAAVFAAAHLQVLLSQEAELRSDAAAAFRHAFQLTDQMFRDKAGRQRLRSGSTGVAVLIQDQELTLAWLGDSQALLVTQGHVVPLMEPHKPEREIETVHIDCFEIGGHYWVLLGSTVVYWVLLGSTVVYWVLLSSTGFYWVLLSSTGFYWVLLSSTGFYWVLLSSTGFYWVLLGSTVVYGVLLSSTGFYCRLLGSTGFYCRLLGSTGFYWVLLSSTGFYWVLLSSTGFYWVLLSSTGFYWVLLSSTGFYWVLLSSTGFYWVLLSSTGFYWVLLSSTGFYWVLLSSTGFYWVLLSSTGFYWVLLSSTGFYWVLLSSTGFYWVLLSSTGFYWVLLSSTGFYWVLLSSTGFYWVLLSSIGFYCRLLGSTGFYWVLLASTGFYWVLLSSTVVYCTGSLWGGDFDQKPYVSGAADCVTLALSGAEDFLLLASTIFFDQTHPRRGPPGWMTGRALGGGPGVAEGQGDGGWTVLAGTFRREAGSSDNITVMVVFLRPPHSVLASGRVATATAQPAPDRSEDSDTQDASG